MQLLGSQNDMATIRLVRQEEKRTLPGVRADVSELACVATLYPHPVSGILTRFPFGIER